MNERLDEYNARMELSKSRQKKIRKRFNRSMKDPKGKVKEEGVCRNAECFQRNPSWHHAVPRSKFGKYNPIMNSVDNAVPLCHECHMQWHNNVTVLYRDDLTASEVAFIMEHAGEAWIDKHYPVRGADV